MCVMTAHHPLSRWAANRAQGSGYLLRELFRKPIAHFFEGMNDRSNRPNKAANLPLRCDDRSMLSTERRDSPLLPVSGALTILFERIALIWTCGY
jgi:hypothetical protein